MNYSAAVREYVSNTPLNKIITTRELLHLGSRSAVDQTMSRLVKATHLIRLARGIFVRAGSIIPSALAIVQAKAAAFGRSITSHGSSLIANLGLYTNKESLAVFCIGGGTTAFSSLYEKTDLIGTCDRKRHLEETFEGKTIRAFWHLGREKFESLSQDLITRIPPTQRERVARQAAWMPAWMSDKFIQIK